MKKNEYEFVDRGIWNDDTPWFCDTEFGYFQMPKALFTNSAYRELSLRAKICYTLLLDRAKLSYVNGWRDSNGDIYVYYSLKNLAEVLGCTETSCTKTYRELEKVKLCRRTRQGQGKPSRVVVCPVIEPFNLRLKTTK